MTPPYKLFPQYGLLWLDLETGEVVLPYYLSDLPAAATIPENQTASVDWQRSGSSPLRRRYGK